MSTEIKLEKFQGPLDLLLQLIEQEELNITEISLSKVTEQYFDYLSRLDESRPEELADFLVIATKLVYLKSRNLLPYLSAEEDDGLSLADQLKMYKRYIEASLHVNKFWTAGQIAYGRHEPPIKLDHFILPLNATVEDLKNSFIGLLKKIKPLSPLPKITIDRTVSVKNQIDYIYNLLKQQKQVSFSSILIKAENRTEVIASFLALLELVKQLKITINQKQSFEDILITQF
ncbi:MAG: hypothetical protein COU29_00800 [Candidatus Magasanikbacteria bacterium CG10_big_fil_rev_8_21_14_0_10_36_32]|uniref:Segregation and condensation protein A n=1 Tax=Candidatus Magasanikbacteria bacterium CG10_big_fil_rev_8_21_14_0_10_36_32 TaxID=1974646 RepID=A0A2M6W6H2_9BACT|nr:MAG: hypothetical protein COU29_00800 [Candidatus Magasanikbacteria bacterium CG10_big_fil_rev_8_21_14_0_10_36_32]